MIDNIEQLPNDLLDKAVEFANQKARLEIFKEYKKKIEKASIATDFNTPNQFYDYLVNSGIFKGTLPDLAASFPEAQVAHVKIPGTLRSNKMQMYDVVVHIYYLPTPFKPELQEIYLGAVKLIE